MKYWFKPKKFWGIFAAYYPITKEGWVITLMILAVAVAAFNVIDSTSHSASDTLWRFSPWLIALLIVWDTACRRTGEYPSWWRKWKK